MKAYYILFIAGMLVNISSVLAGPGDVTGYVYELEHGHKHPVTGANVYWSGTVNGTVTDERGEFTLSRIPETELLVISFVGYSPDTIDTHENRKVEVILQGSLEIEGVEIVKRNKSTELSMIDPIKVEKIGEAELEKAACCNLSESFETNPSVDVAFTDAITGTRQIQMLGLAGPYTQITRENIPDMRGLMSIYGFEYVPGPWIEGIQLNKGTGTVVNGYESMAGQINVELRKPETADQLYVNLFANDESRVEANINLARVLNDKWSTGLLLHGRNQSMAMDRNGDGFTDRPAGDQLIILHRWNFKGTKGWESQFGVKAMTNRSVGGQTGFNPGREEGLWGMQMNTHGIDGWMKTGRVFPSRPFQSFGIQLAGSAYSQDFLFGMKNYTGLQYSGYANFIFQSIIGDSRHKYRAGASMMYDELAETLDSSAFSRQEAVPGIFAEYTWSPGSRFDMVSGLRMDYHSSYGFFLTPRLHMRFAPDDHTTFRLSAGRGQRTASVISENASVLASSRSVIIEGDGSGKPYGLRAEKAWNAGINITRKFRLDYRDGTFSLDLYHTRFSDQVVIDLDRDPQEVSFYNLEGPSYSTSLQSQFDYELVRRLDLRVAYRWYDVKTEYAVGLLDKPLVARHRAFLNLAYATRNHWKFDYTLQWYGPKRLPATQLNPEAYRLPEHSPDFFLMNAQVSKEWREKYEIYLGVENLLDFRQHNPILASDEPFGPYFDSSIIWGPISGRMIYGGMRIRFR